MKNTITAVVLGICASVGHAAFTEIGSDGESKYYVDLDNIKYLNKSKTQRQAWFKVVAEQNGEVLKKGQYMMMLNAFDCGNARFRIDTNIVYNSQKKVIQQINQSSGWMDTVPESRYDQLAYVVCSK